jgi:vitellogenic carboxypeptidase-like protein
MALQGCQSFWSLTLLGLLLTTCIAAKPQPAAQPQPLYSGYLGIDRKPGSFLYYAYWEASNGTDPQSGPILLWLQGGPGCASSFGAFYELGPYVTDANGKLVPNPFAWNRNLGLLIIDQPIGECTCTAAGCSWSVLWVESLHRSCQGWV